MTKRQLVVLKAEMNNFVSQDSIQTGFIKNRRKLVSHQCYKPTPCVLFEPHFHTQRRLEQRFALLPQNLLNYKPSQIEYESSQDGCLCVVFDVFKKGGTKGSGDKRRLLIRQNKQNMDIEIRLGTIQVFKLVKAYTDQNREFGRQLLVEIQHQHEK